ncbi:MAG: hypothetical protein BalsKO_22920 [Balneolaceae bacterium]
MTKKIILLGVLGLFFTPSQAQSIANYTSYWDNYLIRNIDREIGLYRDEVYDSIQDSTGFIWLTNLSYTFKYDGITLKEVGKDMELGTVNDLNIDRKGDIWVSATESGIHKITKDSVFHYSQSSGLKGFSTGPFDFTKGDSVFIGDYLNGVSILYQDSVINHITSEVSELSGDLIAAVTTDSNNRVWIGTNKGLDIFQKGELSSLSSNNEFPIKSVRSIQEMLNGDVWVGTEEGSIIVFRNYKPIKYYNESDGISGTQVEFFAQNPSDSSILIGYYGAGVDRFYGGDFENINSEKGLVSDFINTVRFTKNGLILISTDFGLSILTPKKIDLIDSTTPGFSEAALEGVFQDSNDNIWISTSGDGVKYFDGRNWTSFKNPLLSKQSGRSFKQLSNNKIAVGTETAGVVIIDGTKVIKQLSVKDGLLGAEVLCLETDDKNNLWVGTFGGINVLDSNFDIISSFTLDDGIPDDKCLNMASDSKGNIWIATLNGGLFQMNNNQVVAKFDTSDGLSSNRVFGLYQDSKDVIWFSTIGSGIYNIKNGILTSFQGLPNNVVSIVEDRSNNFWLSSNGYFIKIKRSTFEKIQFGELQELEFQVYTSADGIPFTRFAYGNSSTSTVTKSGEVLFAAKRGLIVINPKKATFNESGFFSYIDEFTLNGKPVNLDQKISIGAGSNKIEIDYSALNLESPEKTKFRIKLSEIDEDWIYVDNRKTAFYDYLPDGSYTFHVSAIGPDGTWDKKTASLDFKVLPPFYKTWWFIGLCFLGFIGIGAGGVQIRSNMKLRSLNRELQTQQKIQDERERISRELHDNVGSQITNLITGIEISNLHVKKNQQGKALSLLENLDSDARSAMTDLRETIWLLDKEEVHFGIFIDHLKGFVKRQERYLKGMNVEFSSSLKQDTVLDPTQSMNLTRIIQEALNNARKYAQASTFKINFKHHSNNIEVTLADDGIGMDMEKNLEKGNGIKNMQKRAEEMNGTIVFNSTLGKGTTIILHV